MGREFFQPNAGTPLVNVGWDYPDRIDHHADRERRRMHVARQLANAFSPLPQPIKILQPNVPVKTDVVDPNSYRVRRRIMVALQKDFTQNVLPQPIKILQPITQYPDFIIVRRRLIVNFDDCFVSSTQPERKLPAFEIKFPDSLQRKFFNASLQQYTNDVSPKADVASFTFQDLSKYPYRIDKRTVQINTNVLFSPQPERTNPKIDASFPDRIIRPNAQQFIAQSFAPQPERTLQAFDVSFSDRILRPKALQFIAQSFAPQPERTSQAFDGSFHDRIARPKTLQFIAQSFTPQPERTIQLLDAIYPILVIKPRITIVENYDNRITEIVTPYVHVVSDIRTIRQVQHTIFQRSLVTFDCWQIKSVDKYIVPRALSYAHRERLPDLPQLIIVPPIADIYTYYDKGGGEETSEDYFAYFDFNDLEESEKLRRIVWELEFDAYSKEVKFNEFALRAFGEMEKSQKTKSDMKRLIENMQRREQIKKVIKISAVSGATAIALRLMFAHLISGLDE